MENEVTEEITNDANIFGQTIKQNVIKNELKCEYDSLTFIKPGKPIEYSIK